MKALRLTLSITALIFVAGCHSPQSQTGTGPHAGTHTPQATVAEPLEASALVLKVAQQHPLQSCEPRDFPGLLNVFHLGEHIISGSEPQDPAALAILAGMGIKTLVSVDGKIPDAASARALGMRYVHIPIQYSGIEDLEFARLVKTFRELEGPFFVHCFHGKHRGPAAAAVGRLVLDGVSRGQAMAEMHQWCGTSLGYEGLFQTIGRHDIPSARETATLDFDFPEARDFEGFRATMVPMARSWDEVKFARKRGWTLNPSKPDIVPAQEALQLSQVFELCLQQQDLPADTDEVRGWLQDGQRGASNLARILSGQAELQGRGVDWRGQAEDAYKLISTSCRDCHAEYRN